MKWIPALCVGFAVFAGCGSSIPNRTPLGEPFPPVKGTSLTGEEVSVPEAFRGRKVIVVIAYKQNAQFDIDRWGVGFFTTELDLPPVYELPTIPGLIPSLLQGSIDSGMKKGIPEESWKDVITVFGGDAGKIAEWTGTENPQNGRVVLLDENGRVLWYHDRGYGLPPLKALIEKLRETR